jgi:hypothetical protein
MKNSGTNLLLNGSFEDEGVNSSNGANWREAQDGMNPSATYVEWRSEAADGNYILTNWSDKSYQTYTYQWVNGLANGTYRLRALAKRTGTGGLAKMQVEHYGGNRLEVHVPTSDNFQTIEIAGIPVTTGQLTVSFYCNVAAGTAVKFDKVELVSTQQSTQSANLVSNPGFEAEQYNTQTPSGWSEAQWDPNWNGVTPNASYSENYGGSKSGNFHGTHWSSSAYQVSTWQTKTGLANGLYTLRVWARSGGGQQVCQLEAKDHGDNNSRQARDITASSSYNLYEINNINVTNNQCTLAIYSAASANQWLYFDDWEFFKQ